MGWLVLALLIVPVIEIYVIVQVGLQIGALPTVILLLAESALGAWLVRREGRRAWRALQGALRTGTLPSRELADAALVLVGGTLLLTPGFVTDVVGFFFVLPITRPLARRLLGVLVARRAGRVAGRVTGGLGEASGPGKRGGPGGLGGRGRPDRGGPPRPDDRVVPGEVVRDDPPNDAGTRSPHA